MLAVTKSSLRLPDQAGAWYAWSSTHAGMSWSPHGMLIMAAGREGKPLDYDELARWTRVEVQARHEKAQEQNAEGVYGIPSEEAGIGPRAIQVTQSKGPQPK